MGKTTDIQKLLTDAAHSPNVEIRGVGEQGRAWVTVGGTKPGALSSLQCPEITRVQLITNVDGTESFILGQWGQKHAEEKQRARDARKSTKNAKEKHEDGMPTVAWLEVTDKRQGKDNKVYIYECKNMTQKLVEIVDQVLLQNDIVLSTE